MKPSPPKTIMQEDFDGEWFLNFFERFFLNFCAFLFLSETRWYFFILVVPSARLELALPKGQGF